MVVNDNALVVFFGKESEQPLAENWLAIRLAKVQNIETFLEKRRKLMAAKIKKYYYSL